MKYPFTLIPDAQVHTHYERLPGLLHGHDIFKLKSLSFETGAWGFKHKYYAKDTAIMVAYTDQEGHHLICPRLLIARHIPYRLRDHEVAGIYYHDHSWHAVVYDRTLLTRYIRHPDNDGSTAALFTCWTLLVQQYPKAGVLTILCTTEDTAKALSSKCQNPIHLLTVESLC